MDSTLATPRSAAAEQADPYSTHAARAVWIGRLGILVSFSHMVGTIALFSDRSPWALFVAAANTLLIDLIVWHLAEYIHFAKVEGIPASRWAVWLFRLALIAAVGLNGGELWAHRPPADILPTWAAGATVILFSILIPGFIAGSSVIRGELIAARGTARSRAAELIQLRGELTKARGLESMLDRERAALAQALQDGAHARAAIEEARAVALEARAAQAQATEQAQAARAAHAQLQDEPRDGIDQKALARALVTQHNMSRRAVAGLLHISDSTVRAWLQSEGPHA